MCPSADLLVLSLISGLGIFAATQLTAKSSLFAPARERLLDAGLRATQDPHGPWAAPTRFFSDAFICPFCTTFWHGFWIVALVGAAIGAGPLACLAAYLPAVGVAKIVHDSLTLHRQRTAGDSTVGDLLKRIL